MPRPDALMVPASLAGPLGYAAASALLGGGPFDGRDAHTGLVFCRLDPTHSRFQPKGHPAEGAERYAWYRGEGAGAAMTPGAPDVPRADLDCVLLGYLPGNEPTPESPTDA